MENIKDEAKERVEKELDELTEKITKLSGFLYGRKSMDANISRDMRCTMRDQLRSMEEYASCLQKRLMIWGKTDEELCRPYPLDCR